VTKHLNKESTLVGKRGANKGRLNVRQTAF
jgi:hypothetical protein